MRALFCVLCLATLPAAAAAAIWPADGLPLGPYGWSTRTQTLHVQLANGPDDAALVASSQQGIAKRVAATGDTVRLWPPPGGAPDGAALARDGFAHDGAGGYFVTFSRSDEVRLTHLESNGQVSPGWPDGGLLLSSPAGGAASPGPTVPDGAAGAFVFWTQDGALWAQRVSIGGVPAAPAPLRIPGEISALEVVAPDGAGGVIALTRLGLITDAELVAHRIDAHLQPIWGAGTRVRSHGYVRSPAIAPDAAGGVFVAWVDTPILSESVYDGWRVRVRAFEPDGSPRAGWPAEGIQLPPLGKVGETAIAADLAGGAFVTWADGSMLEPMRVSATGGVARPFEERRIPMRPSMAEHASHALVADGAGGAYLGWPTGQGFLALRLDENGAPAAPWDPAGMPLHTTPLDAARIQLAPDGAGGAFAAFEERVDATPHIPGEVFYTKNVYVQRLLPEGPAPATAQVARASATLAAAAVEWLTPLAAGHATVERRTPDSDWSPVGEGVADAEGRVSHTEVEPAPGARFGWRLAWSGPFGAVTSGEVWLTVPPAPGIALVGAQPNPATGDLDIAFAVPSRMPVAFELFDLAGRRAAHREATEFVPGRHVVALAERGRLAPGVYLVRMQAGGWSAVRRVIVAR